VYCWHILCSLAEGEDNYEESLDRIEKIYRGPQLNDPGHSAGADSFIIDFMRNQIDKQTLFITFTLETLGMIKVSRVYDSKRENCTSQP